MRLLVVEDDKDINRQVVAALEEAGYVADKAYDGEEGGYLGESEPYDAIILDMGLPKADGVTVLQKWRRSGVKTPVIILTARDRWSDKVDGFDAGADDYVTKPFSAPELLARVRAALRRNVRGADQTSVLHLSDVEVDLVKREVRGPEGDIHLTPLEYRVLECLAGALAQVGGHGVRGVTHQRHPVGGIGREPRQFVQVIVQDRTVSGRFQQCRDGAVPAAETAAQPG